MTDSTSSHLPEDTERGTLTAARFRKRPVVIEALQWDGSDYRGFYAFYDPESAKEVVRGAWGSLFIPTLEGEMEARPGDWIIKGVAGEFYPCKSDIFEATYERVADDERTDPVPEVRGDEAP